MAEPGSRRDRLAAVIEEKGLEVVVTDGGELMAVVAKEAPDAVVLDLSLEEMHGVAGLLELRDNRLHTGLPVMVVTHPGLNEKEREMVQELATLHSDPLEAADKLGRLLDVSFPLASPAEARE
jgi:DNA-binding response OmpR family regulator